MPVPLLRGVQAASAGLELPEVQAASEQALPAAEEPGQKEAPAELPAVPPTLRGVPEQESEVQGLEPVRELPEH